MDTPVHIRLDDEHLEAAKSLAIERFAKQEGNPQPEYDNTLGGHFVGACGEVAAYLWASQKCSSVQKNFMDLQDATGPDIIADSKRIEVKTWSLFTWKKGGRCVTPSQLRKYQVKSIDAVLWCHWKDDVFRKAAKSASEAEVSAVDHLDIIVADWSTLEDIEASPVQDTSFGATPALNHKVEKGKAMDDLLP